MKKKFVRIKLFLLAAVICTLICACAEQPVVYNGEFLERKLTNPYIVEGILTQNGEKYDVTVDGTGSLGDGDFKVKFLSGDVTEGLTVEFFENGVFLFFDDLRFKTNNEAFTNLEALKNSFEILSAAHIEKYVTDLAPVDGVDIIEIGVKSENGDIHAYVNQLDGTIIRLITNLNGTDIALDIKKFENIIKESENEETSQVVEVIDDYIEE